MWETGAEGRRDGYLTSVLPSLGFPAEKCPFDPLPIPQATGKTMKSRRLEKAANIAPADMGHMKVCSVVPTHRNFQAPVGGRGGGEGGILLPGHIRTSQSPFCPQACC